MNDKLAITVIIFNRSDYLGKVFKSIKEYKPNKIFIVADGPRKGVITDQEECKITRLKVEKLIDWECIVYRNYSEINLGCGSRIKSGLDWVFSIVESSIILEDDCVASFPFYGFCEEMIQKYKDDKRIMHISGNNFTPEFNPDYGNYFFSKYGHIWGWATWSRAWKLMDYEMKYWLTIKKRQTLRSLFSLKEYQYFEKIFNTYYYDIQRPWGQRWFYSRMINNGLSIVPNNNLVSNVGIVGTHSQSKNIAHYRETDSNFLVTLHPDFVIADSIYEKKHFAHFINRRQFLLIRILKKIKRILQNNLR